MDESVGTTAAPEVSAPAVDTSSVDTSTSTSTSSVDASTTDSTPAEWAPSYKYKANNEEKELPELFRGIVKDADTEKQVKELFEKAEGIDAVKKAREEIKAKHEMTQREYESYKQENTPINQGYKAAVHYWKQASYSPDKGIGNLPAMDALFKTLGLPEKAILHYVNQKLDVNSLPEGHRSAYNQNQELMQQMYDAQQKLSTYEQREQEAEMQLSVNKLESALTDQSVAGTIQAFDESNGQGSFRNEVLIRGKMYQDNGINKEPNEVVNEILQNRGLTGSVAPQQAQRMAASTQQTANGRPPVIPVVKGGGSSAVVKNVSSLEDLKKIRRERFG